MKNFEPKFLPIEGKKVISSITLSNNWEINHAALVSLIEKQKEIAAASHRFEFRMNDETERGYYLTPDNYEKLKVIVLNLHSDQSKHHILYHPESLSPHDTAG